MSIESGVSRVIIPPSANDGSEVKSVVHSSPPGALVQQPPVASKSISSKKEIVLGKVLGEGETSRVYSARKRDTNELIALKVVNKSRVSNPVTKNLILQELSLLKNPVIRDHPNMVTLISSFQDDSHLYYAFTINELGCLEELIHKTGFYVNRLQNHIEGFRCHGDSGYSHGSVHEEEEHRHQHHHRYSMYSVPVNGKCFSKMEKHRRPQLKSQLCSWRDESSCDDNTMFLASLHDQSHSHYWKEPPLWHSNSCGSFYSRHMLQARSNMSADLSRSLQEAFQSIFPLFPIPLIVHWFDALIEVLRVLRRNFIAHRDIKPDNIFVSSQMVAVLGDFNNAVQLTCTDEYVKKHASVHVGSVAYWSPERVWRAIQSVQSTAAQADSVSESFLASVELPTEPPAHIMHNSTPYDEDAWSMGCVLYELLMGCRPFTESELVVDTLCSIARYSLDPNARPTFDEWIPYYMREACEYLLSPRPEVRRSYVLSTVPLSSLFPKNEIDFQSYVGICRAPRELIRLIVEEKEQKVLACQGASHFTRPLLSLELDITPEIDPFILRDTVVTASPPPMMGGSAHYHITQSHPQTTNYSKENGTGIGVKNTSLQQPQTTSPVDSTGLSKDKTSALKSLRQYDRNSNIPLQNVSNFDVFKTILIQAVSHARADETSHRIAVPPLLSPVGRDCQQHHQQQQQHSRRVQINLMASIVSPHVAWKSPCFAVVKPGIESSVAMAEAWLPQFPRYILSRLAMTSSLIPGVVRGYLCKSCSRAPKKTLLGASGSSPTRRSGHRHHHHQSSSSSSSVQLSGAVSESLLVLSCCGKHSLSIPLLRHQTEDCVKMELKECNCNHHHHHRTTKGTIDDSIPSSLESSKNIYIRHGNNSSMSPPDEQRARFHLSIQMQKNDLLSCLNNSPQQSVFPMVELCLRQARPAFTRATTTTSPDTATK